MVLEFLSRLLRNPRDRAVEEQDYTFNIDITQPRSRESVQRPVSIALHGLNARDNHISSTFAALIMSQTASTPLPETNAAIPPTTQETTDADGLEAIGSRFAYLHSELWNEARAWRDMTVRIAGLQVLQVSRPSIKQRLVALLDDRLSQYGEFIDSRGFRVIHQLFHLPRNSTLGEFLSHGPNIQGNFDHESWLTYKDAVRRLLNEPASRELLDQDTENFLDWDKLERSVAAEQGNPASNEVTGWRHEEQTEEVEDLNEEERDDDDWNGIVDA